MCMQTIVTSFFARKQIEVINMLNLHKLDVFSQVVRVGSFSRAAEAMLMTQSAVSHHIRDLEVHLGTTLFVRGPRGVTLTQTGETLHEYTVQIFELLAEVENRITNVKKIADGQISIGATPGASTYLLPEWILAFHAEYPNLTVNLKTGTSADNLARLHELKLDMAIIEGELDEESAEGLTVRQLQEIEQRVVVGPNHPWWGRDRIAINELAEQDMIMRQPTAQTRIWLDEVLARYEIEPRIKAIFDNVESIKRTVARGASVTILPPYSTQEEEQAGSLRSLGIDGRPLLRRLKLLSLVDRPLMPAAQAFLRHLEKSKTAAIYMDCD